MTGSFNVVLAVSICLFIASFTAAQSQPESVTRNHRIVAASGPIDIDGAVNEAAWRNALKLDVNVEVDPGENVTAPVLTEVFLTYDRERLLVAFKCYDPDPARIRARFRDRDSGTSDDWVGVVLDTFNDERRAYAFYSNPLGIQRDELLDDVTGDEDESWNAIWDAAGEITEAGYEVEMAIPFSQLRFQDVESVQTWGIDVLRNYPRTQRYRISLFPRIRGANSYLSQAHKLTGFSGLMRGRNIEITPTFTTQRTDARDHLPEGELREISSNSELGLNIRWGATPNITVNGAFNPDFSQVEADSVQLGINEQFTLFFPETRPFFLDGADFFNTAQMNLLHTRRIASPDAALKVTGKEGRNTFAALAARDELATIIIPGPEGSRSRSLELKNTSTALRYRYDFGRNSTIGTMFTNREGNGYYNRMVNVDGRFRFDDANSLRFSVAGSQTRYTSEIAAALGQSARELSDLAYQLRYDHSQRNYRVFATFMEYGENFRTDLGFVTQVGDRSISAGAEYRWIGGSDHWFNEVSMTGDFEQNVTSDGRLLERAIEGSIEYNGPLESEFTLVVGGRDRTFEGVEYNQLFWDADYEMRLNEMIKFETSFRMRDWIDFAHNRPADEIEFETGANLNIGRHLTADLDYSWRSLDVEPGRLFSTRVFESRMIYTINARTFVRGIFQYAEVARDPTHYAFEVDAVSKEFFTQLLFSYKVNAQTLLFLGYTDGFVGTDQFDLTRQSRTFFVKMSYAWLP